jgi:arylsulfatase A-like enzyme/Flp pilus assembly protein TadD
VRALRGDLTPDATIVPVFRVALFFALCTAGCGRDPASAPVSGRPDLLLITIDTLRADRVGGGLTPNLDALAAQGLTFTKARAPVPLTLPSHVSMLTGALPPQHGVRENGVHAFSGSPPSVVRALKDRGYRTAAFVGAYVLDRRFGLADGFDHYDDQIARDPNAVQRLEAERPANVVVDRVIAWLRSGGRDGVVTGSEPGRIGVGVSSDPVFMWVHFYDPHAPYAGSYDDEVKFADAQAGRLLEELRTAGRDPVVIVAGDHGEGLGDHGEATHGMLVYETALRVPLIVAGRGVQTGRRDDPVSLIDIAPTLAALGGAPPWTTASARHLLAAPAAEREIYAETLYPRVAGWSPVYTLVQDRWKLVASRGTELYDLATDAAEQHDVAASRQALVFAMASRLEMLRTSKADASPRVTSPEVSERLRALGYVAGSSTPSRPGDGPNPAGHIAAWSDFEAALAALRQRDRTAVARLRKLAEAFPDAPVFQSTYARALSEGGSAAAALAIYRRAVTKWPNDAVLFHELAVAARRAGRFDEALKAEQAALVLEPSLPSAHNGIGLMLTDAGRHADAAAAFEQAAKGDSTNAEYWVNLGNARRAAGRGEDAATAFRRASEIDPRSADAANGLGVLLVQQGRPADAIPLFERAILGSPHFVEARLNLAIAYQESGARDRAVAAYRDVLTRSRPGSREHRAATDLLRSLER